MVPKTWEWGKTFMAEIKNTFNEKVIIKCGFIRYLALDFFLTLLDRYVIFLYQIMCSQTKFNVFTSDERMLPLNQ